MVVLATYNKEVDPGGDSIVHLVSDNLPLLEGIITIITVVSSAVGTGVTWLRKQNIKQYTILKDEMGSHFDTLRVETARDIKSNQEQIENTKQTLQTQITTTEHTIKDKIETQKDTMNEIKDVVNKIDDKMDITSASVARNTARIDSLDSNVRDIEGEVFRKKRFSDKSTAVK
jgi:septal ring factor EnvC (AmiA/AmiB activator)